MDDSSTKRSLSHFYASAGEAVGGRRRRPVKRLQDQPAVPAVRSSSRKRSAPSSPPKAAPRKAVRRTTRKKSGGGGSSTFKAKGEIDLDDEEEEDDGSDDKDSEEEESDDDKAKAKAKAKNKPMKKKKKESDDDHEQAEDDDEDEEEEEEEEEDEEEEDYAPRAKRSSARKRSSVRRPTKRAKRVEPEEDEDEEEEEEEEEDTRKRSKKAANGDDDDDDDEDGDYGTSSRSRKGAKKRGAVVRRSSRQVSRNPKYDAAAEDDEEEEDEEEEESDSGEEKGATVLHIDKMLGVREDKASKGQEYLVKYRGRSYLHVEWVDRATIEGIPGGKARLKHFASKHEDAALLDDLARRRRLLLNRQRHSATALPKPDGTAGGAEQSEGAQKHGADADKMDEDTKKEKEENAMEIEDAKKKEKDIEGEEEGEEEEEDEKKVQKIKKKVKGGEDEDEDEDESEEEDRKVEPGRKFLEELVESGHFDREVVRVDRVVAQREGKRSTEYLIKWKTLPYEDATWEAETELRVLVSNWAKKLRQYKAREKLPALASRKPSRRPKASTFDDDADYVPSYSDPNLTLRDYQVEGIKWLVYCWYNRRNSILADEMGLGKTLQSVSILQYLVQEEGNRGPFLVVAPMSTIEQWRREVEGRTFMNCVVFHGTEEARNLIRKHEFHYTDARGRRVGGSGLYKFHILITTFEMVLKETFLGNIDWQYMVIDEGHRIKSKKTKLFQQLFQYNAQHKLILTGTPMQNHIEELWTMLHFLNPEEFDDAEAFKREYGDLKTKEQVDKLQASLRPYMLRRMKEDVDKTIPLKEETIVEVELTSTQKKYYRAILDKNREFLYRGAKSNANLPQLTNILMELRKCCNHPYLIAGAERRILDDTPPPAGKALSAEEKDVLSHQALVNSSSKLVLLDKLLTKLREDGHKVLIFSQMVMMLDILEDYLIMRGFPMERLDGGVGRRERQAAIDRFTNPEIDSFAFLLSTRAGGLGLNLTAANTVIIYDSDWNPQNDLQAQARAHRIGQTQQVKMYRFVTRNTYESYMLDIVSKKLGLESAIMNDDDEMKKEDIDKLLKYGAYHLFQEDAEEQKRQEHVMLNEDIHSILGRAHTIQYDRDTEEKGAAAAFKGLSKVTYATSSSDMDINLDDDNFWEKVLPEMKTTKSLAARVAAGQVETEAQRAEFIRDLTALVEEVKEGMMSRSASYAYQAAHSGRELHAFIVKLIVHKSFTEKERERLLEMQSDVGDGKRTRTQVQRMGQERGRRGLRPVKAADDEGEEASEYEAEDSDGSSPSEATGKGGKSGATRETLQVRRERLSGAWSAKQLKILKSWLLASGYGRWQELLESNVNLTVTKHPEQVQALAECLVQLCFHNDDAASKDADKPARSRKRQYRQILEEKSFYAQVLADSLSGTLTDLMTMHKKWAAAHAKKPVSIQGNLEVDVLVRDGVGRMNGFDGKYWPGHVLYVEVKVREPEKDQMQLFLLVSLLDDAKHIDAGYIRTYPLTKKKPDEEFYTAVVHAPGFVGKYSLDVVYFETRQYPSSSTGKGKFTERRCSMHVWHEMSPADVAEANSEADPAKHKLSRTTAAATPTSFKFSVTPHPLVATGETIDSLQRQRKQYNVRLFILRHLKTFLEQHDKNLDAQAMPKLTLNLPADWWTTQDDRNLLVGVHRHGWGKIKDIRDDPKLGFSVADLRVRTQKQSDRKKGKSKKDESKKKKEKEDNVEDEEKEDEDEESRKDADDDPDFPTAATLNKRLTRLVEELATTAKPPTPVSKSPAKKLAKTKSSSSSRQKSSTAAKKETKETKGKEKKKDKRKKEEPKSSKGTKRPRATGSGDEKEAKKRKKPTPAKAKASGKPADTSNGKHDDDDDDAFE